MIDPKSEVLLKWDEPIDGSSGKSLGYKAMRLRNGEILRSLHESTELWNAAWDISETYWRDAEGVVLRSGPSLDSALVGAASYTDMDRFAVASTGWAGSSRGGVTPPDELNFRASGIRGDDLLRMTPALMAASMGNDEALAWMSDRGALAGHDRRLAMLAGSLINIPTSSDDQAETYLAMLAWSLINIPTSSDDQAETYLRRTGRAIRILCDNGYRALNVTDDILPAMQGRRNPSKAFLTQVFTGAAITNALGKYQKGMFTPVLSRRPDVYREYIMDILRADPLKGTPAHDGWNRVRIYGAMAGAWVTEGGQEHRMLSANPTLAEAFLDVLASPECAGSAVSTILECELPTPVNSARGLFLFSQILAQAELPAADGDQVNAQRSVLMSMRDEAETACRNHLNGQMPIGFRDEDKRIREAKDATVRATLGNLKVAEHRMSPLQMSARPSRRPGGMKDTENHHENPFSWARFGGYECSSKGDARFSAFGARMPDGRSLEAHYQCDVKGYDPGGTNWRLGKGKPPRNPGTDTWGEYLALWQTWAQANPRMMADLRKQATAHGGVLSDRFASGQINQARALAHILNTTQEPNAEQVALPDTKASARDRFRTRERNR